MQELGSLVTAARAGDAEAYAEIVCRFQSMAYGFSYSMLGDSHVAEDVAAEAFLQAYQDLPTLREPSAFVGWFRRILHKHCHRVLRKRRVTTVPLALAQGQPASEPDPAQTAESQETRARVLDAVQKLPEAQRTATTLFYMEGRPVREIAEFLDTPIGTIKRRLHDARHNLRERMMTMVEGTLKQHSLPDGKLATAFICNNCLTTVSGNAAQLKRRLPGGAAEADLADQIVHATAMLAHYLGEHLPGVRRLDGKLAEVDLHQLIRDVGREIGQRNGIEVKFDLDAQEPAISGYRDLLHDALLELGLNACDAMPKGGDLTFATTTSGNGIELTIRDTGHGMDERTREWAFSPFFTTKAAGRGTGSGLPAVDGCVKYHGGTIECDTQDGRGTVFRITLPA